MRAVRCFFGSWINQRRRGEYGNFDSREGDSKASAEQRSGATISTASLETIWNQLARNCGRIVRLCYRRPTLAGILTSGVAGIVEFYKTRRLC